MNLDKEYFDKRMKEQDDKFFTALSDIVKQIGNHMDDRFAEVDQRFDEVNLRLNSIETKLDDTIERVDEHDTAIAELKSA